MDRSKSLTAAVSAVFTALEPLKEEERGRVIESVRALFGMAKPATAGTGGPGLGRESQHEPSDNIADFVASKRPVNNYQKLACLAYYLEHAENKVDISGKDLARANTDARGDEISNMTVFLTNATRRHGYFAPSSNGKKRLTQRGKAVVDKLPDQAAVKAVLAEFPRQKKGHGRRTKKRAE